MSSKNVVNKFKVGLSMILMLSSVGTPVFASEQYPGHDYPEHLYSTSSFTISRIDLTNNQLEFSLNADALYGKEFKYFGAGWITDSLAEDMDLLSYDSVSNVWSQRVFWNDTEEPSKYLTFDDGTWRKYTVDSEVDLKNNTSGRLFYIAEFGNGSKWISRVTYTDCLSGWAEGMSCDTQGNVSGVFDFDHTIYGLVPVRKKIMETSDTGAGTTAGTEVSTGGDETTGTTTPTTTEPTATLVATEVVATEKTDENNDVIESATVKTVKNIAVVGENTEEIDDETEEEEEESDYSPEGPGDTTLEVPILGKTEEITFNWLPYFLGGLALGGVSTWFLVTILNRRKLSFLR